MGSCCSKCKEEDKDFDVPNERTPILRQDHSSQGDGGQSGLIYSQESQREDEQSEISRILRQTAINIIDVTSTDSHNLEQGYLQDRTTQYSNRLNMVLSGSGKSFVYQPQLPSGITSPHMILSAPPISLSEVQLITAYSEKLAHAAREIKIQHKENLVVPFKVS